MPVLSNVPTTLSFFRNGPCYIYYELRVLSYILAQLYVKHPSLLYRESPLISEVSAPVASLARVIGRIHYVVQMAIGSHTQNVVRVRSCGSLVHNAHGSLLFELVLLTQVWVGQV